MKNILSLIALLIFCSLSNAQTNTDSLWGVWNQKSNADTLRLKALSEINISIVRNNPDSSFVISKMILDLAIKKGLKNYQAEAYFVQGKAFSYTQNFEETAKSYARSVRLYEEIGDKSGIARTLAFTAGNYDYQGEYLVAIEYGKQVMALSKEIGDTIRIAGVSKVLGHSYYKLGEYTKAIKAYENGLIAANLKDDKLTVAYNLQAIGNIYKDQGEYQIAYDYYNRSLKIHTEINDKAGIASNIGDFGILNLEKKEYQLALAKFDQSLKLFEEINHPNGTGSVLYYFGLVYMNMEDFPKAFQYFNSAQIIAEEANYQDYLSDLYIKKGLIFLQKRQHQEALIICKKALVIAEELKNIKSQKDACNCLYRVNKSLGNTNKALEYLERDLMISQQIQLKEISKNLQKMEYSQEKFRDSIAVVEAKRREDVRILEIKTATDRRHRIQYSIIFGIVFTIFSLILISRKISISKFYVEGLIFFAFLMLFEFLLVLISPFIGTITNGEPAFMLLCNAAIAGIIIPVHSFFEKILKTKLIKT